MRNFSSADHAAQKQENGARSGDRRTPKRAPAWEVGCLPPPEPRLPAAFVSSSMEAIFIMSPVAEAETRDSKTGVIPPVHRPLVYICPGRTVAKWGLRRPGRALIQSRPSYSKHRGTRRTQNWRTD